MNKNMHFWGEEKWGGVEDGVLSEGVELADVVHEEIMSEFEFGLDWVVVL